MHIVKKFLEWIKLKEKLHENIAKTPLFKEGEVWWCAIGENIGNKFVPPEGGVVGKSQI